MRYDLLDMYLISVLYHIVVILLLIDVYMI